MPAVPPAGDNSPCQRATPTVKMVNWHKTRRVVGGTSRRRISAGYPPPSATLTRARASRGAEALSQPCPPPAVVLPGPPCRWAPGDSLLAPGSRCHQLQASPMSPGRALALPPPGTSQGCQGARDRVQGCQAHLGDGATGCRGRQRSRLRAELSAVTRQESRLTRLCLHLAEWHAARRSPACRLSAQTCCRGCGGGKVSRVCARARTCVRPHTWEMGGWTRKGQGRRRAVWRCSLPLSKRPEWNRRVPSV